MRTELWPHTISNEDDGDDTTCDSIGLAKFLACFTFIMTTCEEGESAGRAEFLHGISLILENLPWSEARIFHNVTMIKIEQGRINWDADFSALGNQFLDRKVRLSLRSRSSTSGVPTNSRSSFQSVNKGYGNGSFFRNNPNRDKPFQTPHCMQWNFGECTYGVGCKRWHTCLSCFESGKVGEPHKASEHYRQPRRR